MIRYVFLVWCVFILISCHEEKLDIIASDIDHELSLFTLVEDSGVDFNNVIVDSLQFNIFSYEYNYNGGGVAIGDINNDGLPDLYFSGTYVSNRLYLNRGNMRFEDITSNAGVDGGIGIKTGVSMLDINDDGFLDIYVCKSGNYSSDNLRRNKLYINNGDLTFSESASKYHIDDASHSTQGYFADFNNDGSLDLYLVNHPVDWKNKNQLNLYKDEQGNIAAKKDTNRHNVSDRLYIRKGERFYDMTKEFGVGNFAFGLSAMVNDYNQDGFQDIYVCNDYNAPDHFYINKNGKYFIDSISDYFSNISQSSMGSDVADFNGDGMMDIYTNDMMPYEEKRLKNNNNFLKGYDSHLYGKKYGYHDQFRYNSMQIAGGKKYENLSFLTGTHSTDWSWAVLSEDFNSDSNTDIYITNGYLKDVINSDYSKYFLDSLNRKVTKDKIKDVWIENVPSVKLTNFMFANRGKMKFEDVSKNWFNTPPSFSNGAAYGDLDNDGDLDIVVNNINDKAFIYRNHTDEEGLHYVNISLKDQNGQRTGYGAKINAEFSNGATISKLYNPCRGYMSSMDHRVNISGRAAIRYVIVNWPDGTVEKFEIKEEGEIDLLKGSGLVQKSVDNELDLNIERTNVDWQHRENTFIDFKREPLLHLKNSVEGPAVAVAKDGSDDVLYLGGAIGQAGIILRVGQKGNHIKIQNSAFENDKDFEDVASMFVDVDDDDDLDLIVASGGYQYDRGSEWYKLRLYKNTGDFNYEREDVFPDVRTNAQSLLIYDIDKDGDQDIFLGGGAIPNMYPKGDKSYVLINEGGFFKDRTVSLLPERGDLGIVKSALKYDINNDGFSDLIYAGDWTPIQVLLNNGNSFTKSEGYGFEGTNGLWQTMKMVDVDHDGDLDLIAGNLGENSFFHANEKEPMVLHLDDFDHNGELDPILSQYFDGRLLPVHPLPKLLDHMTSLRKKFLRFSKYAGKSTEDIFGKAAISKSEIYKIYTLKSSLFVNEGNHFSTKELPYEVQLSMVKGITSFRTDDGKENLIFVGNFWDTDFTYGKYDASKGVILEVDDNLGIKVLKTNLYADGNVRGIINLPDNTNTTNQFLITENNDQPYIITLGNK